MRLSIHAFLIIAVAIAALGHSRNVTWRPATEAELREIIPARAPVEKERIETEFRTASAITDGSGRFVAGVVLITAGYAAEGKYSNFFIAQVPIKVGDLSLKPGEYVFGWRKQDQDSLDVQFLRCSIREISGRCQRAPSEPPWQNSVFPHRAPGRKTCNQDRALWDDLQLRRIGLLRVHTYFSLVLALSTTLFASEMCIKVLDSQVLPVARLR